VQPLHYPHPLPIDAWVSTDHPTLTHHYLMGPSSCVSVFSNILSIHYFHGKELLVIFNFSEDKIVNSSYYFKLFNLKD
jgi:hypothetical protein